MTKSQDHFDEFKPHTRLKHLVLETYLKAWARKLLLRPGAADTVYYIDACAGRGLDDAGNRGSPVLAAREAATVVAQLRDQFHRDVNVRVVAIEKQATRFKSLQENLAPFGDGTRALRGTLPDHLGTLLREMGAAPALFFIDPFGMEPLRADVVYRALERPFTEVFLLFADQAALRHYGVLTADDEEDVATDQMNLLTGFVDQSQTQLPDRRAAKAEELEETREACEAIMNAAFGGSHWRRAVDLARPGDRRQVILNEYSELLYDAGARYVLKIPIRSARNRHVYHLFHATKSPHGHATMKESIDAALRRAPNVGSAAETIRYLIKSDMGEVERRVREHFAGLRVRWAPDKSQPSVRIWALQETAVFPFELDDLKVRLENLRDSSAGRTIVYQFPPMANRIIDNPRDLSGGDA